MKRPACAMRRPASAAKRATTGNQSNSTNAAQTATPHRDPEDHGRYQCVVALAKGEFDVWPKSHKVVLNSLQHDIEGDDLKHLKSQCSNLLCACEPGDVLIFQGGTFVHGSPRVSRTDPSPRVMTYACFWPPGTSNGANHAAGRCSCALPYNRKRKR